MIHFPSFKVMGIDMSYRDTGLCVVGWNPNGICFDKICSYKNPQLGNVSFENLTQAITRIEETLAKVNDDILNHDPDAIIIEMPCFSQSAKSAVLIGMLWGSLATSIININLLEPSALKIWSGSSRGDGKTEVKKKVMSMCSLHPREASNDNIVDAAGICLMFIEKVHQLKHNDKTN